VAEYSVNGSAPSTLAAASGAAAQVSAAIPAFSATGVYSVCVTCADLAGNIGADECIPPSGLRSGGGFVTVAVGSTHPWAPTLRTFSLTGKATFGFESRYQNGANVPSGDHAVPVSTAKFNLQEHVLTRGW
jgi:hypothetical protein